MKKQMTIFFAALLAACVCPVSAEDAGDILTSPIQVSHVSFTQSRRTQKVTVHYNLSNAGYPAYVCMDVLTNGVSIGRDKIKTLTGDFSASSSNFVSEGNNKTIVWDARHDWRRNLSTNAAVRVYAYYTNQLPYQDFPGVYMVVDLSKGTAATADNPYPVSYTFTAPAPLTDYACISNQLWLKRIEAGTFTMGCSTTELGHNANVYNETARKVTIKKAFFAGVFPVTRAQYQLVMGGTAPGIGDSLLVPVNQVSYDTLRGSTNVGINWPDTTNQVAASSFLGILRSKTGDIEFDLPTQAQHEYANRAGTTNGFWNDGSVINEENLKNLGWYEGNSAVNGTKTIHQAGQKKPNLWGLYDMHGNSWDWCLDWWQDQGLVISSTSSEGDRGYVGLANGSQRALKGGSLSSNWADCRPARSWALSSNEATYKNVGFRLFVTLP